MMLWRGRLIFRQCIKNKIHKYGVKIFELCQHDGLILRMSIYSDVPYTDAYNLGQTDAVVMHLLHNFLDKGHVMYSDNDYNSVVLVTSLRERKTGLCGTLNISRHLIKNVVQKKLKPGNWVAQQSNSVTVCKWKVKREMLMISNMHKVEMVSTKDRREGNKRKWCLPRIGERGTKGNGVYQG